MNLIEIIGTFSHSLYNVRRIFGNGVELKWHKCLVKFKKFNKFNKFKYKFKFHYEDEDEDEDEPSVGKRRPKVDDDEELPIICELCL